MTNCKPFESKFYAGQMMAGCEAPDGGSFLAGLKGNYLQFTKTTPEGAQSWNRSVLLGKTTIPYSVASTSDGGFVVAGDAIYLKPDGLNSEALLLKRDGLGKPQWGRLYFALHTPTKNGDDYARGVSQTLDGGFMLVGASEYGGSYKAWLIKTDQLGMIEWKRNYGCEGTSDSFAWAGGTTIDGGNFIAGGCDATDVPSRMMLIKTNAGGGVIFNEQVQFDASARVFSAKETSDGGFLLAGDIENDAGNATTSIVARLGSGGELLWYVKSGMNDPFEYESATFVEEDEAGDVIAGGYFEGENGQYSWVRKFTGSGVLIWSNVAGEDSCGAMQNGALLQDGGLAMFGSADCGDGSPETAWISKVCL